jgi:hypothetical protein
MLILSYQRPGLQTGPFPWGKVKLPLRLTKHHTMKRIEVDL